MGKKVKTETSSFFPIVNLTRVVSFTPQFMFTLA